MKRISSLLEVEEGKRYFIMENRGGQIRSAVLHVDKVKKDGSPYGFVTNVFVNFTYETGDVIMGPFDHVFYMAEV
jgi:hypothetical protein